MSSNSNPSRILAIRLSDRDAGLCALFADDGMLALHDSRSGANTPLATLDNIREREKPIGIDFHHPYICVAERFGLNAAVVDTRNGSIRSFTREDYHANVSSYSIGFLEHGRRTLLIHQTQWNRLDITDLESGELLTPREVFIREISPPQYDENKKEIAPRRYEEANYLDFFHSILHIAPDSKSFLSNGWVWSPWDNVRCFDVEEFLQHYEPSSIGVDYGNGYNWDRPCAFIDNDSFVIATDDNADELDDEERKDYRYRQLWFYRLSDRPEADGTTRRWLPSHRQVACDVFFADSYKEVKGQLYYDGKHRCLVALSGNGAYAVTLEGQIVGEDATVKSGEYNAHTDFGSHYAGAAGWDYSAEHHVFYTYDAGERRLITKPLSAMLEQAK